MATIKLKASKSPIVTLRYDQATYDKESKLWVEREGIIVTGVNSPTDYMLAHHQWAATRKLWDKDDYTKVHGVIQSFAPGEFTPETAHKANAIGVQLAEKLAPGYEVLVTTHVEKDHIHNHIRINSVHPDTGKKYHCHGWGGIQEVREESNKLCKANGLSIPTDFPTPDTTYSLGERSMLKRGKDTFRDELREAIDGAIDTLAYPDFKLFVAFMKKYGIEITERGKHITYTHPEGHKARGSKLGANYTKEGVISGIKGRIEIEQAEKAYRTRKPGTDVSLDRSGGVVGGVQRVQKFADAVRNLTPSGKREAEERQRQLDAENARINRQREAYEREQRKINKTSRSSGRER